MRDMKDSGVEWIGKIPAGWITIKIKHVAFLKGRIGWQGLTSTEYQDEGAYLITGTDFENGFINWQNCVHITEQRYNEYILLHIRDGDLLITKDGTIGKLAIVSNCPEKVTLNSGVMYIRSVGKYKYTNKFLYYVLLSNIFWDWYTISQRGNSTIKHLYQEQFYNFSFPLPPLPEQIKIASYLDDKCSQIDSIITAHRKIIDKLKQYKSSLITETVTRGLNSDVELKDSGVEWIGKIPEEWGYGRIKYNYYLKGRIGWQGLKANEFIDNGPYLITGTDFENGSINWEKCYHISEERYNEAPEIHVKVGDLLITKDGTVGKVAFIDSKPDKVSLNSHLLIMRPINSQYSNKFLFWVIHSNIFDTFFQLSQNGSIMASLSQEKINNFSFPLPPLHEQIKISSYLDDKCSQIDSNINKREQIITKLTEYKKSLIYELVTGKQEL